MLHLNAERLAALADDEPNAGEARHIAECVECARERATYRALLRLSRLGAESVVQPPASDWPALAARLRDEGVIRTSASYKPGVTSRWLRAAAAILVVGGAAVAGRWSAPASNSDVAVSSASIDAQLAVGSTTSGNGALQLTSVAEAVAVLERAQRDYRMAVAYLAAQDTTAPAAENPARFRARLAALDEISGAALSAVSDLPLDPIINQYYQAALTARQVTLGQLGNALPTGVRLTGY